MNEQPANDEIKDDKIIETVNSIKDENIDENYSIESTSDRGEKNSFLFSFTYSVRIRNYMHPIIISLIISSVLTYFVYSYFGLSDVIPDDTPAEGLSKGMYFAISAAVSSFIIVLAVKLKGEIALKVIMSIAFLFLTFMLILFYGDIILYVLFRDLQYYPLIADIYFYLAIGISILIIFFLYKERLSKRGRNYYVLTIGTLIGSFMATILPLWTAITMLVLISIWDIISVTWKHGPIRRIMEMTGGIDVAEEGEQYERDYGEIDWKDVDINLGVGDIAFYSMLTAVSYLQTEHLLVAISAAIGILIGAYITITALKKNRILPGLPLSICFGLALTFISNFFINLISL